MAKKAVRLKVTDRDRGWRKLKRTLATTTKPYVEVGVRGEDDARPGGEIGNVELAAVHEFGAAAGPTAVPAGPPKLTAVSVTSELAESL